MNPLNLIGRQWYGVYIVGVLSTESVDGVDAGICNHKQTDTGEVFCFGRGSKDISFTSTSQHTFLA